MVASRKILPVKGVEMPAVKPEATRHDAAHIVGLIAELIAENGLGHGERLPPIRELAVRFGVKAGTVRDGLLAAQGKEMVKLLPRVGAIVQSAGDPRSSAPLAANLDRDFGEFMKQQSQNLFHTLETRETLELAMIARAAKRRELPELLRLRQILEEMSAVSRTTGSTQYVDLDIQFHLEIGRLSGNTVMTSLLAILMEELKPHLDRIRWSEERREEADRSHGRIYSSLVSGNVKDAEDEIRTHIRSAYNTLLDEIREPPSMNGGS